MFSSFMLKIIQMLFRGLLILADSNNATVTPIFVKSYKAESIYQQELIKLDLAF